MNLNGDYISDAFSCTSWWYWYCARCKHYYETGHAIFEATHGTAPKYAGLNKVNPSSVILSSVLMLEHLDGKKRQIRLQIQLKIQLLQKLLLMTLPV